MATQLQLRRDVAADLVSVTPVEGEPGYDKTNKRLIVGDGSRAEGIPHASLFDVHAQRFLAATAAGTADALTLDLTDGTLDFNPTAYATFQRFVFKAASNNTGAATLNVASLGVKTIKKVASDGTLADLAADDLVADRIYEVTYDGTYFVLGVAAGGTGTVDLIAEVTASSSSSLDFEDIDFATYSHYLFVVDGLELSAAATFRVRFKQGGSYVTTGSYNMAQSVLGVGARSTGATSIVLTGTINGAGATVYNQGVAGRVELFNADAGNAVGANVLAQLGYHESTGGAADIAVAWGSIQNDTALQGIRFLPSTGTFVAGKIRQYGVRR